MILFKVWKYVENYIVYEKKNSKVKWYNKYGLLYWEFCIKGIFFENGIFLVYCFRENLFISDEISLWFYISRLFRYLEDNNLGFFG